MKLGREEPSQEMHHQQVQKHWGGNEDWEGSWCGWSLEVNKQNVGNEVEKVARIQIMKDFEVHDKGFKILFPGLSLGGLRLGQCHLDDSG